MNFPWSQPASRKCPMVLFGLVLVMTLCCGGPKESPEEDFLSFFLGGLSEGRGCAALMHFVENSDIECREDFYRGMTANRIIVNQETACVLTDKDVPRWQFGYDYDMQVLGVDQKGRVWIYEGKTQWTFVVSEERLFELCPGKHLPSSMIPLCECTPIPYPIPGPPANR